MAKRRGNCKLRHVRVGLLWIQERIEDGDLAIEKVLGTNNPADLMTKNFTRSKIDQYMELLSQEFKDGRAEKSLRV